MVDGYACRRTSGDSAGSAALACNQQCAAAMPALACSLAIAHLRDAASTPRDHDVAIAARLTFRAPLRFVWWPLALLPPAGGPPPARCLPRETHEPDRAAARDAPGNPGPPREIGTNTVSNELIKRFPLLTPLVPKSPRGCSGWVPTGARLDRTTARSGRHPARRFLRLGRRLLLLIARIRRRCGRSGGCSGSGSGGRGRCLHARGFILLEVALLVLRAGSTVARVVSAGE